MNIARLARLFRSLPGFLAFLLFAVQAVSLLLLPTSGLSQSRPDSWEGTIRLGKELREQGRYQEAERVCLAAVQEADQFDETDSRRADALSNLGLVYRDQGKLSESERVLTRAAAVLKATRGQEHLDLAVCFSNLALVYFRQGRVKEAEELLNQALNIFRKQAGEDNCQFHANPWQSGRGLDRAEPISRG